jgi:heme/copper-type cytochrome/quinol oxidase subunit 4
MKIVNIVLGLGTAIILGSLITLGIKAFYPEPVAPTYPNLSVAYPNPAPSIPCDVKCKQQEDAAYQADQARQATYNQEQATYDTGMKVYDRNLFIVANIVGIIIFLFAFWLLFATSIVAQSVPIGIMIAGLYSIMYGYAGGWGSVDDKLKFFIGLVIALLVIGGSMWLIERYAKKRKEPMADGNRSNSK